MITICDFEDSFTYNLYSDFVEDYKVSIVQAKDVKSYFKSKLHSTVKEVIVLGPGPGHPSQYKDLHEIIKGLMLNNYIFLFGVCLGHQIIWEALGKSCIHSKEPVHGQSIPLDLTNSNFSKLLQKSRLSMQRYNSLCISLNNTEYSELDKNGWTLLVQNTELLMSYKENLLTYQFHPESIGTSCKNELYIPVKTFLI